MAIICELCGETRGLFHNCAKKDADMAEQVAAAKIRMQQPPESKLINAKKLRIANKKEIGEIKDAVGSRLVGNREKQYMKEAEMAQEAEIEEESVETEETFAEEPKAKDRETEQDEEIKRIVELIEMITERQKALAERVTNVSRNAASHINALASSYESLRVASVDTFKAHEAAIINLQERVFGVHKAEPKAPAGITKAEGIEDLG